MPLRDEIAELLNITQTRVSRMLDRTDPGPGFSTMDGGQVQNVYGWTPGKVIAFEVVHGGQPYYHYLISAE